MIAVAPVITAHTFTAWTALTESRLANSWHHTITFKSWLLWMRVNVFMNKIQMFYHLRTQASCYKVYELLCSLWTLFDRNGLSRSFGSFCPDSSSVLPSHWLTLPGWYRTPTAFGEASHGEWRGLVGSFHQLQPGTLLCSRFCFHTRRPLSLVWRSTLIALYCSAQTPLWDASTTALNSAPWTAWLATVLRRLRWRRANCRQTWADSVSKH